MTEKYLQGRIIREAGEAEVLEPGGPNSGARNLQTFNVAC